MVRATLVLIWFLAAVSPAHSFVTQPQETTEPETQINATFPGARRSSGALPIRLVNGNRIYVPSRVNGRPVSALLDTGAAWTVIDRRFAAMLGLRPEGYRTTRGTGGTAPSQYAYGVSIDLGHLRLRNVTVLVMDLSDVERRLGISLPVIVGPEAFGTVIADLHIPRRRATFWRRDAWRPPAGAVRLPAVPVVGHRAVPLSIEGRPEALFIVDIGNGSTPMIVQPHYAAEQDLLGGRRTGQEMAGAIGGERPVAVARLREVRFAGRSFVDVPARFPPADGSTASQSAYAGNLGMPLLGRFRLITDFAEDAIWVVPGQNVATEFERDRSGITFTRTADALIVVAVAGPAATTGLKVGDRITGVRIGRSKWVAATKATGWNRGKSGTTIALKLATGEIRSLTLADYF